MTSFDSWWSSLGFFTRCSIGMSVGLTALSHFQVVNVGYFLLTNETWKSLQLWRPLTASFFFGNFSFPWLFSVMMMITYMNYNELYDFPMRPVRFLWFLLWLLLAVNLAGFALGFYVTSFSFCMSLCWTFCRRNSEQRMKLYGFSFSAGMFPWALMCFHLLIGQPLLPDLVGAVAGHSVLFLFDVLSAAHSFWFFLTTPPRWLEKIVSSFIGLPSSGSTDRQPHTATDARRATPASAGFFTSSKWGAGGRRLGDN